MAELYKSALSKAQEFTEENTDWKQVFKGFCDLPITDQANVFLYRFTQQLTKQDVDGKELVKKVIAIGEMFTEKEKDEGNKALKYGGVGFGDIYNEFVGENLTFMERKKRFGPFDLDNNGRIDVIEFLLYIHKEKILTGFKERNDTQTVENEAEALIQELVNVALFVDPKLDAALLGLKKLKEEYEKEVKTLKDTAADAGGVKKIQLAGDLQKAESKYTESQKGFLSQDAIGKKKAAIETKNESLVKTLKAELEAEAEEARGPTKKK